MRWRGTCWSRRAPVVLAWVVAVAARWLCPASAYQVGLAGTVEDSYTDSFKVAALGDFGNLAIACYFDVGTQYALRCAVLDVSFGISAAPSVIVKTLVFVQAAPATLAVAALDATHAVVCYGFAFKPGSCKGLSIDAATLTLGVELTFVSSAIQYLSLSALSGNYTVACYYDQTSVKGKCTMLQVDASTLALVSLGTVAFNVGATGYISVARLDGYRAIVCYQDAADFGYGKCNVVKYDPSLAQMSVGADYLVQATPTASTRVVVLDLDRAVVCYNRTGGMTCKSLKVSLSVVIGLGSPDLFVDDTPAEVSLTAMQRTHLDGGLPPTAEVCYRKEPSYYVRCNRLLPNFAASTLTKDTYQTIVAAPTTPIGAARLGSSVAVLCYADQATSTPGVCRVVDFATTTTTTSTRTTTSTMTTTTTTTTSTTRTTTTTTSTRTTTPSPIQPPLVNVTGLTFVDEDLRAGLYGGTLSWGPAPTFGPPVELIAVYFAPATNWVTTRVPLWSVDMPANITFSAYIPNGTSLGTYTHLLVYTVNSWGRQTNPAAVAVHDVVRPTAVAQSLSFFDEDIDKNEILGTLTWAAPASGLAYVTMYRVYIALGVSLAGADLLFEEPTNVTSVRLGTTTSPFLLGNWSHLGVFLANPDEEAAVGAWVAIVDRAVPIAGAEALAFTDEDLEAGNIAGSLTWAHPASHADILSYRAYFSSDLAMTKTQQIGADVPVFAVLSVKIGPAQLMAWRVYFIVVAYNAIGPQRGNSSLPIADRGITFADEDLRRGHISGTVEWWHVGPAPGRLRVYVANGPEASAFRQEVAPDAVSVAFTGTHHVAQLLALVVASGDDWVLTADLTRPTPAGAATVLAVAGSRIIRQGGYTGQPPNAFVLPFTLEFGMSFDPAASSFELPDVNPAGFTHLQVSAETTAGVSLGLRVGALVDLAAPERPARNVTFSDQDLQKNKIGGFIRWQPPADPPRFALQRSGACARPVNTSLDCSAAGIELGLSTLPAMNDGRSGSPEAPPFCYYEGSAVKFNVAGGNTGACRSSAQCICDVLEAGAPPLTRYAVYLADAATLQGGAYMLFAEVDASVTNVTLELGSAPWAWALVLVGNDDGFNEALPAATPLNDVAAYGKLREQLLRQMCVATSTSCTGR